MAVAALKPPITHRTITHGSVACSLLTIRFFYTSLPLDALNLLRATGALWQGAQVRESRAACLNAVGVPGLGPVRVGPHALIVQPGAAHYVLVEPAAATTSMQ